MSEPVKVAEQANLDAGKHWEGRVINGEFRLREYLGGSDHSAVFLTDLYDRDSHTAAIKIVTADSPSGQALVDSCEQAASLSHPNLIHILTAGRAQIDGANVVYVVMEHAEENLAQVISGRPLASDEAREMLKPTLAALSYLHEKGLAHSRLKPANFLATGDQLKISADSIRRAGDSLADSTAYDAPEGIASAAADSWSLGIALIEVLTQRAPEWNRAGTEKPLVSESLPEPFREIARNCLLRDPKNRWSVSQIAEHLDPSAASERALSSTKEDSLPERPPTAFEEALEAARASYEPAPVFRKRSASAYLIPAVLSCVGLAGLVLWFTRGSNSRPSPALPEAASTEAPSRVAPLIPTPQPAKPTHAAKPHATTAVGKPATPAEEPRPITAAPATESASPERSETATSVAAPAASPEPAPPMEGVVREALPKVPQKALDTIYGSVRVSVRVDIDSLGIVKYTKLDSAGPSEYFANQSLSAAHEWKFAALGHPSERMIHFVFLPTGVTGSADAPR